MRVTLRGNADAVDFCPIPSVTSILAAATYTLSGDGSERVGSISLFDVAAPEEGKLNFLHSVDAIPGVFDIRWRPARLGDDPLLGQALSDGSVRISSLKDASWLEEAASLEVTASMCLSLDWDPFASCSEQGLVVSQSDGSVSALSLSNQRLTVQRTWEAHEFEVWAASYDTGTPAMVYTGADDSHFCGWDLRQPGGPAFRNKRAHTMGVCCIQSNPHRSGMLATGSYDEKLRVWDARKVCVPVVEQELELGGGLWRLRWHPAEESVMAMACMHGGLAVVELVQQQEEGLLRVLQRYEQHESLAYGVDWCKDARFKHTVASCSFYDKSLHLWKARLA